MRTSPLLSLQAASVFAALDPTPKLGSGASERASFGPGKKANEHTPLASFVPSSSPARQSRPVCSCSVSPVLLLPLYSFMLALDAFHLGGFLACLHPFPFRSLGRIRPSQNCPAAAAGVGLESGRAPIFFSPVARPPCRLCDRVLRRLSADTSTPSPTSPSTMQLALRITPVSVSFPLSHPCSAPLSTVSRRLLGNPPGADRNCSRSRLGRWEAA